MELLREITNKYNDKPLPILEAINQSVKELKLQKNGGKITNKMVSSFIKQNPKLTTTAALNAISAYQQYKTNKKNTISLFAKSPYEKRMIKRIVDAMIDSGQYKIHRTKYAEGGKYYELKQMKVGF